MTRVFSSEHRRKLSESHKGQVPANIDFLRSYRRGIPLSEDHKKKISMAQVGKKKNISEAGRARMRIKSGTVWNKGKKLSPDHVRRVADAKRGKKHRPDTIAKMVASAQRGEKNVNWRGGITPINRAIRNSREYRIWRSAVFERDKYTCVWCGTKKSPFNADHIKPFAFFPELRFALDNGRTLCVPCHEKTDTYMNRWLSNSYKPK